MKRLLFITAFLPTIAFAQETYNPFESIGKTTEVVSLSNGRYKEVYGGDTVKRIGSVLFDVRTNKVVKFLNENDTSTGYELKKEGDIATRWLSIDPLAAKYPSLSPYVFVNNNPIIYVDPDGRDYGLYLRMNATTGRTEIVIVSHIYVQAAAEGKNMNTNYDPKTSVPLNRVNNNILERFNETENARSLQYSVTDASGKTTNYPIVFEVSFVNEPLPANEKFENSPTSLLKNDPLGNSYSHTTKTNGTPNGENMNTQSTQPPNAEGDARVDFQVFLNTLLSTSVTGIGKTIPTTLTPVSLNVIIQNAIQTANGTFVKSDTNQPSIDTNSSTKEIPAGGTVK